jgi:hypothetical protein
MTLSCSRNDIAVKTAPSARLCGGANALFNIMSIGYNKNAYMIMLSMFNLACNALLVTNKLNCTRCDARGNLTLTNVMEHLRCWLKTPVQNERE